MGLVLDKPPTLVLVLELEQDVTPGHRGEELPRGAQEPPDASIREGGVRGRQRSTTSPRNEKQFSFLTFSATKNCLTHRLDTKK